MYAQLKLEVDKIHTCQFTAEMNKDPTQPNFYNLLAELTATDPWTDTKFTADENALVWEDAQESWRGASIP